MESDISISNRVAGFRVEHHSKVMWSVVKSLASYCASLCWVNACVCDFKRRVRGWPRTISFDLLTISTVAAACRKRTAPQATGSSWTE